MDDRERSREWSDIWARHSGKITGALVGFAFGLFVMWVGLFWALFIGVATFVGYWVGTRIDQGVGETPEWLERLLPPRRR